MSKPGVATPDEFLVTIQDNDSPGTAPIVAEIPGNLHSYHFATIPANYAVNVYALSQQAGAATPVTAIAPVVPGT